MAERGGEKVSTADAETIVFFASARPNHANRGFGGPEVGLEMVHQDQSRGRAHRVLECRTGGVPPHSRRV